MKKYVMKKCPSCYAIMHESTLFLQCNERRLIATTRYQQPGSYTSVANVVTWRN